MSGYATPPTVRTGPARAASEGVAFGVTPQAGLTAVRHGLREAITDVWPAGRVPEAEEWTPHISIAYSRVTGPAGIYEAALAGEDGTADVTIGKVQLTVLGRDQHEHEWTVDSEVPLSGA